MGLVDEEARKVYQTVLTCCSQGMIEKEKVDVGRESG